MFDDHTQPPPLGVGRQAGDGATRHPLYVLLGALAEALSRGAPERNLTSIFEQRLKQLLSMKAVRLREIPTRFQARLVTPTRTPDSIVLGVPTTDSRLQAVLEASCDPARRLAQTDCEMLEAAAHLAALVLEAARMGGHPRLPARDGIAPLVGSTPVMQALRARIERVALTEFTTLIEGESGTGKELVARQIHEISRRRSGPFVAVNCAAVVETLLEAELFGIEERTATGVRGRRGKFEHAEGGTLFLDEVSDLSLTAQAKLLRAVQDLAVERVGGFGSRRINVRIVAATNRPLADMVASGLFRADLYYRLSGVEIHVPPLRLRREDIPELTGYFLSRHRDIRDLRISTVAMDAMLAYDWPGNVRELERLMESAVALAPADRIELDDLPARVRGTHGEILGHSAAHGDSLKVWARRYARLVLERCGGNKRQACRILGISYHTLRTYLRAGQEPRKADPPVPADWPRSASSPVDTGGG